MKRAVPKAPVIVKANIPLPDLSRYPAQGPDLRIPNNYFPNGAHPYNHLTRGLELRG